MCVRRFHARRRREVKAREEVESSDLNHAHNRKKLEIRGQPSKLSASKSSVLQSIYGKIIVFFQKGGGVFIMYMYVISTNHR